MVYKVVRYLNNPILERPAAPLAARALAGHGPQPTPEVPQQVTRITEQEAAVDVVCAPGCCHHRSSVLSRYDHDISTDYVAGALVSSYNSMPGCGAGRAGGVADVGGVAGG